MPLRERQAMRNAVKKLEAFGQQLGFPYSSAVKGSDRLRELRPRAGRSPWRGFYRQLAEDLTVIGAFGPEASVDPRGFQAAVAAAAVRLAGYKEEAADDG